jgi:hypothetical protein
MVESGSKSRNRAPNVNFKLVPKYYHEAEPRGPKMKMKYLRCITFSVSNVQLFLWCLIPLWAKRIGEFIKNGHKKIFTHPYREWKWCLWLCVWLCVTLCAINGLISLPPFVWVFFRPRAGWALAGGQKNSDLSGYLSYFTRYRSKN